MIFEAQCDGLSMIKSVFTSSADESLMKIEEDISKTLYLYG